MSEFGSALDALAAEDLHGLFDGQLLERVADLVVVQNRVAAELARSVRACELAQAAERDGLKSMRSWLVGHALLPAGEAGRIVRAGRLGEQLPPVAAAAADGSVTPAKVAEIGTQLTPERRAAAAEQGHDLGEVDAALALAAATQTHDTLTEFLTRYVSGIDPDGPEPDPTEGRRLTIAKHTDGSISGRFDLDAVGGEKLAAALESIVQAHRPQG